MHFISIALLLTISLFHRSSQGCLLAGWNYTELTPSNKYILLNEGPAPFPQKLFDLFSRQLGDFSADECRNAVVRKTFRHTPTETILTVFHTTQDKCDGGNTYGLIVDGSQAEPQRVIATIEDSFIQCIP